MAKKKLLSEAQVRRFMGLAGMQPTIVSNYLKEGDYGYYFIKQLHDEDGNIYSHMGSAIADEDYNLIPKGTTFTLKFTVKEHSEYNGIKQTKIKNPKLVKGE